MEIQCTRLIAALVEVAGERGAGGVTVGRIVDRAGVSRRTFYELFEDREDCFLTAFDRAIERGAQRVAPAFHAPGPWQERVRASLQALLGYLDDEPGMGALCVVDALGGGPVALERRSRVVNALIDAVHEGRREAKASALLTRLTAEGVVGAVLAVLHARLSSADARSDGDAAPITGLLGPLMAIIVLPYLGQTVAAREAARPAPRRKRHVPPAHGDPLRELDMRITYRTVRVLLAIAELGERGSGPSNRAVSQAADVSDQGQISKLLARLEHLGLVENAGAGPTRGEPNVWQLTAKGSEIEHAIRRQAAPVES